MSLMLANIPNPHDQIRSIQQEIFAKNRLLNEKDSEIAALRDELREARQNSRANELALSNLRQILGPLHSALGMVFGEIETVSADPTVASAPRSSAAWDSWKSKMGGAAARIIDFLMLHGELNHTQLRIHLGTNRMQTVYDAVSKLNRAGLLNKNGDKFSLKEL